MSVQQVAQGSVSRLGVSGLSGELLPIFTEDGKCFVCGANASSAKHKFRSIEAYVYSQREVQEIFDCAGSCVQFPNGNVKVCACHKHKNNLMELCDLVKASGGLITPLIISKAMGGAWFVEVPVTFVVSQQTVPNLGAVLELYSSKNGTRQLIARMSFFTKTTKAPAIMAWARTMLAEEFNSAVNPLQVSIVDFLSSLKEKLPGILDQRANTENPK